jgi:citrate lyase beta subunit
MGDSETLELTVEERSAFALVGLYLPKTEDPACAARLEELLTDHESRAAFRRACEKLLARSDSRQVMTTTEKE